MNGALVALLLLPFAAALAPTAARPAFAARVALAALVVALALAAVLLAMTGAHAADVTAGWVPQIGLGLDFRADRLSLAGAAVCLLLGLALAWRLRSASGSLALALLGTGLAQLLALAANVMLLPACAVLIAVIGFRLEAAASAAAAARARFALFVRIGGALSLFAALLLLSEEAGSAGLGAILAAPPPAAPSLQGLAVALLWLGIVTRAGLWPWNRWLRRAPRASSEGAAEPLLAAGGIVLAVKLGPLTAGAVPPLFAALALLVAPLLLLALERALGAAPEPAPVGPPAGDGA